LITWVNYKLLKKVSARLNYFYMIIRVFSLYSKNKDDDNDDGHNNNNNNKGFKYIYV